MQFSKLYVPCLHLFYLIMEIISTSDLLEWSTESIWGLLFRYCSVWESSNFRVCSVTPLYIYTHIYILYIQHTLLISCQRLRPIQIIKPVNPQFDLNNFKAPVIPNPNFLSGQLSGFPHLFPCHFLF